MKPEGTLGEQSADAVNEIDASSKTECLMEQVVARENMLAALRRVEQNGGAPGSDGMSADDLRAHLKQNWESTKEALLTDRYNPQPVRRVEIPKPDGGVRLLGIPNVVDRLIQQAILQVDEAHTTPFDARQHSSRKATIGSWTSIWRNSSIESIATSSWHACGSEFRTSASCI